MKNDSKPSNITVFIDKYFVYIIYFLYLIASLSVLYAGRKCNILGMPQEGTDQLSMLKGAVGIYNGHWLQDGYKYSPIYTLFLSGLVFLSHGNLICMKVLQAMVCSFIPVIIYKLSMELRLGRKSSQMSSIIFLFYGPAMLISLDFLREAPLSLCFILFVYSFLRSVASKKELWFLLSGICGGVCILGRENFIPLVFLSFLFLLIVKWRNKYHIQRSGICIFLFGILITLAPICTYNYFKYGTLEILPGNYENVFAFYHGRTGGTFSLTDASYKIISNVPSQLFKFISSYEIANSLSFYSHRDLIYFLRILVVPFNLLLALVLVCLYRHSSKTRVWIVSAFIAMYALSMIYFEMFYRFRIPAVPLLSVLAGAGFIGIIEEKNIRIKIPIIVFVLNFLFFTYQNPRKMRTPQERLSVANTLIMNREFNQAEKYIDCLVEDSIDTKNQIYALIESLVLNGQNGRAVEIQNKYSSIEIGK